MAKPNKPEFLIPDIAALRGELTATSLGGTDQDLPGIATTLESHRDALMAINGVVMVGQGQDEVGRDAILVGVKQKHHLKALPKSVGGVKVVGMVIGEVDALTRRG